MVKAYDLGLVDAAGDTDTRAVCVVVGGAGAGLLGRGEMEVSSPAGLSRRGAVSNQWSERKHMALYPLGLPTMPSLKPLHVIIRCAP